jgi:hypothetical protein
MHLAVELTAYCRNGFSLMCRNAQTRDLETRIMKLEKSLPRSCNLNKSIEWKTASTGFSLMRVKGG